MSRFVKLFLAIFAVALAISCEKQCNPGKYTLDAEYRNQTDHVIDFKISGDSGGSNFVKDFTLMPKCDTVFENKIGFIIIPPATVTLTIDGEKSVIVDSDLPDSPCSLDSYEIEELENGNHITYCFTEAKLESFFAL